LPTRTAMTAVTRFALKFFVAVVFFVAFKMYSGLDNTSYIVQHDALNACITGVISLTFLCWALYPFVSPWIFQHAEEEVVPVQRPAHNLVHIKEERKTEEDPYIISLPAPRHSPEPQRKPSPARNVNGMLFRAHDQPHRVITREPGKLRREALANRFSTQSLEAYERYVPRNKHKVYEYE
jgi:hypothetical protein